MRGQLNLDVTRLPASPYNLSTAYQKLNTMQRLIFQIYAALK